MGAIQLFVSHAHKDSEIAASLVDIFEAAMEVPRDAILCTSAPGYGLRIGVDVSKHLREHLTQSSCVVAVLSPYSLSSKWCLFELGGAWAQATQTYPLFARGVSQNDLPAALQGMLGGQVSEPGDLRNLLTGLRSQLNWPERNMAAAEVKIQRLADALKNSKPSMDDIDEELRADFLAKLHFIGDRQQDILNHIVRNARDKDYMTLGELKQAFPRIADCLYYRLMQLRYLGFLVRREISQAPGQVPEYGWTLGEEYAAEVWQ
jgi:hypothetical protein